MKRLMQWLVLGAVVASTAACYTVLNPGRCDKTSDCAAGLYCDLAPKVGADGRCIALVPDGGTDTVGDAGLEVQPPQDGGRDLMGEAGDSRAGSDGGAGEGGAEVQPQCTKDTDCSGATPNCATDGTCKSCKDLPTSFCSGRSTSLPVCGTAGACVACVSSPDCSADPTKPICDPTTNTCGACISDDQCVAKSGANPGVCMSHQDGRCATEAETIYVQNTAGCTTGQGPGSAQQPYCSLDPVLIALSSSRSVVVLRGGGPAPAWTATVGTYEASVIGQDTAAIVGSTAPALHLAGAHFFVRNVHLTAPINVGIVAEADSQLRLDSVLIDNSAQGGISLDGSGFNIVNTTVTGNGPGTIGAITWGGILVQNPPTTPPTALTNVSVTNNKGPGISCAAAISGMGVLATGNSSANVALTCGFSSCAAAGPTCGAP